MINRDLSRFLERIKVPRPRITSDHTQIGFVIGSGSSNILMQESKDLQYKLVVSHGDMAVAGYYALQWFGLVVGHVQEAFCRSVALGDLPEETDCADHTQDGAHFWFKFGEDGGYTIYEAQEKLVYVPVGAVIEEVGRMIEKRRLIINSRYFPRGFAEGFAERLNNAMSLTLDPVSAA